MKIIDLVNYNHVVRGLYLDAFSALPWSEVVKSRSLSFDSMRNVLLHLTLVEDRWIGYIIPGRFEEWNDFDFETFDEINKLKGYVDNVKKRTDHYLTKLSVKELNRQIVVPWGEKPFSQVSVATALTHMVMEDMMHYGELSAALWQMGLEAPYIGFWRYKNKNP